MGPLGPSSHGIRVVTKLKKDHNHEAYFHSHTTPALPFPALQPMYMPNRSCRVHCATCMHSTEECMAHAPLWMQRASKKLEEEEPRPLGKAIEVYEARQRPDAGPAWYHIVAVGYNGQDQPFYEKGIATLPNSTLRPTAEPLLSLGDLLTQTRHKW